MSRDLEFMQNYSKWPRWPWLPLKRRSHAEGVGLLRAKNFHEVEPVVYLMNLFDSRPIGEVPKLVYDSLEALVADGWEVD